MDAPSALRLLAAPDRTPQPCGTCSAAHAQSVGWLGIDGAPFANYAVIALPDVPEVYVDVALGEMREGRFVVTAVFGCRVSVLPGTSRAGYNYTGPTILITDPAHPLAVGLAGVESHPRRDDFWRVFGWAMHADDLVRESCAAMVAEFGAVGAFA